MDRERALDSLAPPYARALRLAAAGATHDEIADDLGIEVAAVAALLEIGARKLARALADPALAPDGDPRPDPAASPEPPDAT
ncbi:MAG TPA: hypothetical protein VIL48_06495 [Acidimicrobiales bacterium]